MNFFFKTTARVVNLFEILNWGVKLFNVLENSDQPKYQALKMTGTFCL